MTESQQTAGSLQDRPPNEQFRSPNGTTTNNSHIARNVLAPARSHDPHDPLNPDYSNDQFTIENSLSSHTALDHFVPRTFEDLGPTSYDTFDVLSQQADQDAANMYPLRRLNDALFFMDTAQYYNEQAMDEGGMQALAFDNVEHGSRISAHAVAGQSPDSLSQQSIAGSGTLQTSRAFRYPVLKPLLPFLKTARIPPALASDLMEHYFASAFKTNPHPASPYLQGFVFSRRAFLNTTKPRKCRLSLLSSMLWIAAHTCDAAYLASSPQKRVRICQTLLDLTLKLLRPLVHTMPDIDGQAVGSEQRTSPSNMPHEFENFTDHRGAKHMTQASLDDVATYMHLATIVSAGENKSASTRWWSAAWNLAREMRLGQELPTEHASQKQRPSPGNDSTLDDADDYDDEMEQDSLELSSITEQDREERRRLWWVLYIVDRHLSLCYNRPLMLQDRHCQGLLRPVDEAIWQTGDFSKDYTSLGREELNALSSPARTSSVFEFTGPSIFGYFLPLMAILGEIIDLVQATSHPHVGHLFKTTGFFDAQGQLITSHLHQYMGSVDNYRSRHLSSYMESRKSKESSSGQDSRAHVAHGLTGSHIEGIIATAYAEHITHVLHVLVTGRWDPIDLLDDNEWISTPAFVAATEHAVSGAKAIKEILDFDPELNFMPWLYGIYLLQGSFLLLLVADRLQTTASSSIVSACSTIVRAHEACVVTLNTEYQRNFRKIMQSALAQVHGRLPEESIQQERRRRREMLALYRWSRSGGGLAI